MPLCAAACSARGTERAVNQDHVTIHLLENGTLLAVIADGLGGYAQSEAASALAASLVCTHVEQSMSSRMSKLTALTQAVQAANLALWESAVEREQPMKTTLTALVCTPDEALLAHVGDCRTYVLRAGEARLLTRDHSRAHETRAWRWLLRAALPVLPASDGPARHSLTRVLGDQPIVQVDTVRFAVEPHDRFILCSDGIWSGVSPASFAALAAEQHDEADLAHTLVCEAQARGSTDDASVIVISFGAMSAATAEAGSRPPLRALQPAGAQCDLDDSGAHFNVWRLG